MITAISLVSACGDGGTERDDGPAIAVENTGAPETVADGQDAAPAGVDSGSTEADDRGTSSAVAGCNAADTGAAPADLHAAAAAVLTATSPCAFSSCHQGSGKAGLVLADAADLNALLVGKMACEAPNLPLVDGSGGDAALANSWLWLKLVAPFAADGSIQGHSAWGTPGACGQAPPSSYGVIMPLGSASLTSETNLAPIRAWICAGAPGPI